MCINCSTDILHDRTKASVSSEHGILLMSLEGTAHTIAECGEQLAWLQASYANMSVHYGMSNTLQRIPVINNMTTLHVGIQLFDE